MKINKLYKFLKTIILMTIIYVAATSYMGIKNSFNKLFELPQNFINWFNRPVGDPIDVDDGGAENVIKTDKEGVGVQKMVDKEVSTQRKHSAKEIVSNHKNITNHYVTNNYTSSSWVGKLIVLSVVLVLIYLFWARKNFATQCKLTGGNIPRKSTLDLGSKPPPPFWNKNEDAEAYSSESEDDYSDFSADDSADEMGAPVLLTAEIQRQLFKEGCMPTHRERKALREKLAAEAGGKDQRSLSHHFRPNEELDGVVTDETVVDEVAGNINVPSYATGLFIETSKPSKQKMVLDRMINHTQRPKMCKKKNVRMVNGVTIASEFNGAEEAKELRQKLNEARKQASHVGLSKVADAKNRNQRANFEAERERARQDQRQLDAQKRRDQLRAKQEWKAAARKAKDQAAKDRRDVRKLRKRLNADRKKSARASLSKVADAKNRNQRANFEAERERARQDQRQLDAQKRRDQLRAKQEEKAAARRAADQVAKERRNAVSNNNRHRKEEACDHGPGGGDKENSGNTVIPDINGSTVVHGAGEETAVQNPLRDLAAATTAISIDQALSKACKPAGSYIYNTVRTKVSDAQYQPTALSGFWGTLGATEDRLGLVDFMKNFTSVLDDAPNTPEGWHKLATKDFGFKVADATYKDEIVSSYVAPTAQQLEAAANKSFVSSFAASFGLGVFVDAASCAFVDEYEAVDDSRIKGAEKRKARKLSWSEKMHKRYTPEQLGKKTTRQFGSALAVMALGKVIAKSGFEGGGWKFAVAAGALKCMTSYMGGGIAEKAYTEVVSSVKSFLWAKQAVSKPISTVQKTMNGYAYN